MPALGKTLVPALIIAGLSATAGAQQKACEIDEGTPSQVARAVLNISMAQQSANKPADAAARLRDAVKMLTDGDVKKNPVGRAFVLGKVLVLESADSSLMKNPTRGAVGFVDNPTAPYDLIAGIDSALSVVEASNPDCAAQTAPWRQQKIWVDLVNGAANAANAGKLDSAAFLANRSLKLNRSSPYAYAILAEVAKGNNKPADAIANYNQAITVAAKDTALADNRRQWLYQLGTYAADLAEQDSTNKARYIVSAKEAFDALAKDPGTKFADAARAGQARIAMLSGDTGSIKASYADQLANPGAFSYNSLMMAAVTAAKANQNRDALKLFEAARAANPYHRDALYNVGRLYLLDSNYTKGIEAVRQLITVDPSNPDNYQLLAIAYASLQKGYQTKERALRDSSANLGKKINAAKSQATRNQLIAEVTKLDKPIKAYADSGKTMVDSAIKYNDVTQKLPARVTFNEFTVGESGKPTVLGGTVANQTDSTRTFTLSVEFVDKSGQVVPGTVEFVDANGQPSTADQVIGTIEPRRSKTFRARSASPGIAAFRYRISEKK